MPFSLRKRGASLHRPPKHAFGRRACGGRNCRGGDPFSGQASGLCGWAGTGGICISLILEKPLPFVAQVPDAACTRYCVGTTEEPGKVLPNGPSSPLLFHSCLAFPKQRSSGDPPTKKPHGKEARRSPSVEDPPVVLLDQGRGKRIHTARRIVGKGPPSCWAFRTEALL